jgi:anthranilate phosphoribosyltransferase
VAACGVPVAKHGNRAASSKAGAADTLEALGLNLDRAAQTAEQTLADLGICLLPRSTTRRWAGSCRSAAPSVGARSST